LIKINSGFEILLKAREADKKSKGVRFLNALSNDINFNATKLTTLINFKTSELHEPALTKEISTETIKSYLKTKNPRQLIFDFPCHTQGVERFIPLISNISDKVAEDQREGYALATIKSRQLNSTTFTKKGFNF
jgi:hypothetical protein